MVAALLDEVKVGLGRMTPAAKGGGGGVGGGCLISIQEKPGMANTTILTAYLTSGRERLSIGRCGRPPKKKMNDQELAEIVARCHL